MNVKRSLESRIRGWFPQEPLSKRLKAHSATKPETTAEHGRKAFKIATVANAVLLNIFLGINFLVLRPFYHYYMSLEVSLLAYGIFAVALVAVNLVIYRHYKQHLLPKGGLRWG
jgi:hypothetical protein